ncbi:MAG: LysM peptidoglycan-binding domain-containing protein, partial [Arcobacter sp.]|nr:LysM peptidoglycan-binding domain-containing protein [Arcobacter sp.]
MGYDKFTGLSQINDEYKKAVATSLLINEIGQAGTKTTGYELSNAQTGKSGWSFGGQQLDLSERSGAVALLKDIYTKQYGASSWTSTFEASLTTKNSPNSLTNEQKAMVNIALSSVYGKDAINKSFIQEVNNYTNYIDKVEKMLQQTNLNIKLSLGEKLMLADYHNQYNLELITTSSSALINKMKNYIKTNGDITPEWLKELFKTTPYYENNPIPQETRINNTYNAAIKLDNQALKYVPIIDNGVATNLYYDENSPLLIYGKSDSNPSKVSFINGDGTYEIWEKSSSGIFEQTTYFNTTTTDTTNQDQYKDINGNLIEQQAETQLDTTTDTTLSTSVTITKGDSIWALAPRYNTTVKDIVNANPWLKDKSNADMSHILVKPGDKIHIPNINNTGQGADYTYGESETSFLDSGEVNHQVTQQLQSLTSNDAKSFIANYDGTMDELQQIQKALSEAY